MVRSTRYYRMMNANPLNLYNMAKATAPFTPEQVIYLEIWQRALTFHPFTCNNEHEGDRVLVPTELGWMCPTCEFTQDWCLDFMCESHPRDKITRKIIYELSKEQLRLYQTLYQELIAAKKITGGGNPDAKGLIFRRETARLKRRIDEYEFSHAGDLRSSKEDPSSMEGNAE